MTIELSSPAAPQLRVLVVDDNIDAAQTLCALLKLMGCATTVAFDGAQGLATAAGFDPHLALIDLEMPGMGGCEVARNFRARQPRSAARLICLTGRSHPEDRRRCIDAGFDEFFIKPLLPNSLAALVGAAATACRCLDSQALDGRRTVVSLVDHHT